MSEKDSKTERPTARRLQKAREKGQVARSREIPASVVLFGMIMILSYFGMNLLTMLQSEMREYLNLKVPTDITVKFMSDLLFSLSLFLVKALLPLLLAAAVMALAANLAQTGLVLSWEALQFQFSKLSPKNGFSRIFSKSGLMELAKSIGVLAIVGTICYQVMSEHIMLYPRLLLMNVNQLLYWISTIGFKILLRVSIAMLVIAAFDYAFQKYRHISSLKMTKQEIKEEFKDMEGDPITKGRIRRIQREMARKRMMTAVPEADVIITNPTHYAVALSYSMEQMEAPKVIAKGVGFLAIRIKELAQKHNIPMVENRPLAQTLYKTVEVGAFIPATLYKAVAEILAYVYKARNHWRSK